MNLLSPAICETREGDLLILWGGRRIVTRYLDPPLSTPDPPGGELERVWRRRYRWDSGPLVLTVISANGTERRDYIAATLARNPAVIDDKTGRVWVGFRVPVISAQDPFGVYFPTNPGYVRAMNAGTTAGMNMWTLFRRKDYSLASGAWPFEWQEQLPVLQPTQAPSGGLIPDLWGLGITQLLGWFAGGDGGTETGGDEASWDMPTDWTEEPLTGDLYLRGRGGNLMDEENIRRWTWNEAEGLGHTWTAGCLLPSGQQARLANNQIVVSAKDSWTNSRVFSTTFGSYGRSGSLRCDERGTLWVAGHVERDGIPWQVEDEEAIRTVEPSAADVLVWESRWAEDNEKEWVIANADVPAEEYAEGETPPTPEDQAAETARLASYYYALPTLYDERPGYCISTTGQQYLAWVHGNLTAVPQADGTYKAVGLRVAVSRDNGRSFEPVIPERIGALGGTGA